MSRPRGCRLKSAQLPRTGAGNRHARGYTNDWMRASRRAIAAHVAKVGWVCPGFNRPTHPVEPGGLTGDHRLPRAFGGTEDDGVDVLCQSCNSERGQRTRVEVAALRADGQLGPISKISSRPNPLPELRPGCFGRVRVSEDQPDWFA